MKTNLFTFFLFFYSLTLSAQDISFSSQEEHAVEWMEATSQYTGPAIGSDFPVNTFTTLENKTFRIPQDDKKLYVLHFWFVGCGALSAETDYLRQLQEEFKDHPEVAFISFVASPEEDIKAFLKEQGSFGYELVSMESKEKMETQLRVKDCTTHMLVNSEGKVLENFTAVIDFDEMYEHYKNKILNQL